MIIARSIKRYLAKFTMKNKLDLEEFAYSHTISKLNRTGAPKSITILM